MSASVLTLCLLLIDDPREQEKFQYIYDNYGNDMIHAAWSVVKDFDLAEDAVQDALLKIALVVKNIDMTRNPRSFAITAAKNAAINIVKKNQMEKHNIEVFIEHSGVPLNETRLSVDNADLVESLSHFIMGLSSEYAEIFVLRIYNGMSYKDISKVLGTPEATLRKRMERLRKLLTEYIKGEYDDNR